MYIVKVVVEDDQGKVMPGSVTLHESHTPAGALGYMSALAQVTGNDHWWGNPEVEDVRDRAGRMVVLTNNPANETGSDAGFWKGLGLDAGDGDDWIVTR